MEGLYEKLLKELTYRELDYIIENPNKILNYIYINSKSFSEEQNSKTNIMANKENEKPEQNDQNLLSNIDTLNSKAIKKKVKYIKRKDTLIGVPFLFMTNQYYIKASLEVLMELHYGFDTLAENLQREIFVGRMDGVAFQAESHEYCLDA